MPTIPSIIPRSSESAHWYTPDGTACHEVLRADGSGMRPTTLRDARKLGLLPSVTTILKVLHKQALVEWLISTACLSVLTAPKLEGEDLDSFVKRVLTTEKQQDQEAQKARDLGTNIHAAIEIELNGGVCALELEHFVGPAMDLIKTLGTVRATEKIVVGDGYAGKLDCIVENNYLVVLDFKSCKKLPKESFWEHQMQTAAYAAALGNAGTQQIKTANIYISTTEPGQTMLCIQDEWQKAAHAFHHMVRYWHISNDYDPIFNVR